MKRLKSWLPLGLIGLLGYWVGRVNYQANTYLLGWDSVWSEANIGLSIRRSLFGVWQEFQGVGLNGGHGYVSDLVHTVWVGLISLVVPMNQVRYVSIILLWVVGGWGIYFLSKWLSKGWIGLVASVVYMLHPFTIQQFYVPHDSFVWFFAFVPWSVLALLSVMKNWTKRGLLLVLLTQVILSFAGFLPPQMVAYGLVMGIMMFVFALGKKWGSWKKILILSLVMLVAHGYWLFPFVRYGMIDTKVYLESKLNMMTTEENGLKSVSYGGWSELMTGQGYYYESLDVIDNDVQNSAPILFEWMEYWDGVWSRGIMVGLFVVTGIGILSLIWKSSWSKRWIGVGWVVVIAGMASRAWPVSYLSRLFNIFPVLDQAFRIGFTKFSILYVMLMGLLVVIGLEWMGKVVKKWGVGLLAGMVIIGVVYVGWPVLDGELFYKRMRVEMPREYHELIGVMKELDVSGRVAMLPAQSYNGWMITDWGYTGSGFLFYGIEQPILDRAFDVWSPYNESFYNEFSTAMYGIGVQHTANGIQHTANGIQQLQIDRVQKVLEKYDVRYVLLDESVIAPGQGEEILRIPETKEIAEELEWEKVFDENFLTVWKTAYGEYDQFVGAPVSYVLAEGETVKVRRDVIYEEVGAYIQETSEDGPFAGWRALLGWQPGIPVKDRPHPVVYPFAELMREEVDVKYGDNGIQLMANGIWQGRELVIPGFQAGEMVEIGYRLRIVDNKLQIEWEPVYRVNGVDGPKLSSDQFAVISDQVRDKQYLWVQIGESEVMFLEEGKQVDGSVKLTVGDEVEIKIYDGVVNSDQSAVISLQGEQRCGEDNMYRCYAIPLNKPSEESLLQVVTVYEGGVSPEVCLDLEGEPYECANEKKMGESPMVTMLRVDSGERYWLDYVLRDEEAVLQDPIVRWYELVESQIMKQELWEGWGEEQRFDLEDHTLNVEVVGVPRSYDFSQLGRSEALNCDVLERGKVGREIIGLNPQQSRGINPGTRYTADEYGSNCDHIAMNELDVRMSYLMRMQGENIEGRSVKLFLHNTGSERNDLEYLLNEGEIDQTFSLLSWDYPGSYSLNVEVRSFGQYSENKLEPVEVRWFPLEQIAGAKIVNSEQRIINDVRVGEVKKTGTWLYRVEVEGEGLIVLSQGYDEGWIAWDKGGEHEFLEHVKANGWKNGWLVNGGEGEVMIFYWPQLLEYLGFLMLGVSVVWIAKK